MYGGPADEVPRSVAMRQFIRRLLSSFRSSRAESELDREIRSHLQLLEDKYVADGMCRQEARYAARRAFGGVEQVKERQRDARMFRSLAGWPMDLKLGLRMLVKSPGLTVIGVIALGIAIAGGAAYLEFVNDFFRPKLAFANADRLVGILNFDPAEADVETRSMHDFVVWQTQLSTAEAALETDRRLLHVVRLLPDAAGQPVAAPQVVEDGAADPVLRVRRERRLARRVVLPHRVEETDGAPADQVLGRDLGRLARHHALDHLADEGEMALDLGVLKAARAALRDGARRAEPLRAALPLRSRGRRADSS